MYLLFPLNKYFMLIEHSQFDHYASVPWPSMDQHQLDWIYGVEQIERWLLQNVGSHFANWTWADSGGCYRIGVGFRRDQDKFLFVLVWA